MSDYGILFKGPFKGPSGYSNYGRALLRALGDWTDIPIRIQYMNYWGNISGALTLSEQDWLDKLSKTSLPDKVISVQLNVPDGFSKNDTCVRHVGITMFETDRVPTKWIKRCSEMDYVFVPSKFCVRTFAEGGIPTAKLGYLPMVLDENVFNASVGGLTLVSGEVMTGCLCHKVKLLVNTC